MCDCPLPRDLTLRRRGDEGPLGVDPSGSIVVARMVTFRPKSYMLARSSLSLLYPKLPAFRELARSYDPSGKFHNDFLDVHVFG